MKLFEALKAQADILEKCGVENAFFDAKQLLLHAFSITNEQYTLIKNESCEQTRLDLFKELCKRRQNREPLQYILGSWDFYGYNFYVDNGCLIPRQETEIIVDKALSLQKKDCFFVDMCTGSGCIGISYALENKTAKGLLLDISNNALNVAKKNVDLHKLSQNLSVEKFDVFTDSLQGDVSLIMCNPPYIDKNDMQNLEKELSFEPQIALYGGEDGLDFYKFICKKHFHSLVSNGHIIFEVGYNQAHDVAELLKNEGAKNIEILKDSFGVCRTVIAEKKD